ncbi:MAG: hypothetical protein U9N10_06860 [Bacillota bacterium]|nr:hypothetical protein [Bacillota bacterium]
MSKEKRNMILGIILIIFTFSFVVTNRGILLSDISRNGGTIISLKVTNNVKIDEVKASVSKSTNINSKNIKIENTNGDLRIKLALLEPYVIDSAEKLLISKFGSDVQMTGYSIIGKPDKSVVLYIVYVLVIISFLLSIYIISKNIISISSQKSNKLK